jgi:virginiamycin A acetyltransferase
MPTICSLNAKISPLADIEESLINTEFFLGPGSTIDSFVKVKMAGGTGHIRIGEHTTINSGCVLYSGNGISIGNNVAIAANCTLAPTNHEFRSRELPIIKQKFQPSRGGIVIEDDVWIGAGSVLLDGAILRKGCVVGAMSLVRGEVQEYSIQCGNPLRLIGWRA